MWTDCADDARVAAKILLPHLITEHGNIVAAVLLLARNEGASQQRLYAEDIEEMVAGRGVVQMDDLRSGVEIDSGKLAEPGEVPRSSGSARAPPGRPGHDDGWMKSAAACVSTNRIRSGSAKWQRTQNGRVDDAEHRRGGANAKRQSQHGDNRKSGRLAQLPQRKAKILANRIHAGSPTKKLE